MDSREAERLHEVLAVLAPPRRFGLLLLLLSGVDRSVCQLASAVGLSQSCTTRHLQALERAGLVRGTRDGKRVVFRTAPRGAAAAGVLASLAGQSAPAKVFVALAPAPRAPGRRRRTDPGATARRRAASKSPAPVSASEVVESRPSGPIAAAGTPTPHAPPESGNNSAPASPPPRHWQELEDYLL